MRGWTAWLMPLTVNGLTCASSMVLLDSARRKVAFGSWRAVWSAWV
jgi:hypothetical protein